MGVEELTDGVVLALLDRGAIAVAGVVDQHVDAAEPLLGRRDAAVTWASSVTSSGRARAVSGYFSARSWTFEASRAVTTALSPRARTASAKARPRPVEQPVMNQVVMISCFRGVLEAYDLPGRRRRRCGAPPSAVVDAVAQRQGQLSAVT